MMHGNSNIKKGFKTLKWELTNTSLQLYCDAKGRSLNKN